MSQKRELSLNLAQKIVNTYHSVPQSRENQVQLIGMRGYTKLRGKNIHDCPDNQIHTVASRILNDCYQRIDGRSLLQATIGASCTKNYQEQLYRTFNIPMNDSDPNYIPQAELERMLLD